MRYLLVLTSGLLMGWGACRHSNDVSSVPAGVAGAAGYGGQAGVSSWPAGVLPTDKTCADVERTTGQCVEAFCFRPPCDEFLSPTEPEKSSCQPACYRYACEDFSLEQCPTYDLANPCEFHVDCDGKQFCSQKWGNSEIPRPACLTEQSEYSADGFACCPGLQPRCGFMNKDGSCDRLAGPTHITPSCQRCGDSVCSRGENHCSCPEDCAPGQSGSSGGAAGQGGREARGGAGGT